MVLVYSMHVQINLVVHIHGVKDMVVSVNEAIVTISHPFFAVVAFGDSIGFRMQIIHKCALDRFHVQQFSRQIRTVFDNESFKEY